MKCRSIIMCAAVLLALFLTGCQDQSDSASAVRVVDHEAIFRQSEAGKASMEYLQGLNQQFMEKFTEMQKTLEEATDEEKANAQTGMQDSVNNFRAAFQSEQERVVETMNDAFTKALEDYRSKNKIAVVLSVQNVVSYDPALDATNDVIAVMNAMNIEVVPLDKVQEGAAQEAGHEEMKEEPAKEEGHEGGHEAHD